MLDGFQKWNDDLEVSCVNPFWIELDPLLVEPGHGDGQEVQLQVSDLLTVKFLNRCATFAYPTFGLRTGSGRKADHLPLVGLGVESATGALNPMKVVENPHTERPDWHEHLLAEVGQRIFDAGRFGRMHGARNEAISLEAAKRERQHLLRDSTDGAT